MRPLYPNPPMVHARLAAGALEDVVSRGDPILSRKDKVVQGFDCRDLRQPAMNGGAIAMAGEMRGEVASSERVTPPFGRTNLGDRPRVQGGDLIKHTVELGIVENRSYAR